MAVTTIQIKRGTSAQWGSSNPVLSLGELGLDTDTGHVKIGDGSTHWSALGPLAGGSSRFVYFFNSGLDTYVPINGGAPYPGQPLEFVDLDGGNDPRNHGFSGLGPVDVWVDWPSK